MTRSGSRPVKLGGHHPQCCYENAIRISRLLLLYEIIGHALWLYHRFCLSFRDTGYLLTEGGVVVSYESIRELCLKFGPHYVLPAPT